MSILSRPEKEICIYCIVIPRAITKKKREVITNTTHAFKWNAKKKCSNNPNILRIKGRENRKQIIKSLYINPTISVITLSINGLGVMSAKMEEQGIPKAYRYTKAAEKLAKTVRINFIGTLDTYQNFTSTREMLNQEKQNKMLNLGRRILFCFS